MYWGQEGKEPGGREQVCGPRGQRGALGALLTAAARAWGFLPSFVFCKLTLKGFIKSFVQMAQDRVSLLTLCSWVL